ncbi:hypothetical protein ACQKNX_12230 [Lysinibacillus sp. NPDC093712]
MLERGLVDANRGGDTCSEQHKGYFRGLARVLAFGVMSESYRRSGH